MFLASLFVSGVVLTRRFRPARLCLVSWRRSHFVNSIRLWSAWLTDISFSLSDRGDSFLIRLIVRLLCPTRTARMISNNHRNVRIIPGSTIYEYGMFRARESKARSTLVNPLQIGASDEMSSSKKIRVALVSDTRC